MPVWSVLRTPRKMLKDLLETAHLSKEACAGVLDVDVSVFEEWLSGQRRIPTGYARALSGVLGVPVGAFDAKDGRSAKEQTPAIWFRLRQVGVTDSDRRYVAVIRRLAHLVDQFETATASPAVTWRGVFDSIRQRVNMTASPVEQGRTAAQILRAAGGLGHGASGIGGALRGYLRSLGILVVETPVPKSMVEGCSFYVQSSPTNSRPCIFANTYSNTWFRRNSVLCHETAHLIFDAPTTGASIDFNRGRAATAPDGLGTSAPEASDDDDVVEQRADAFAREMLAPPVVLRHVAQAAGIDWRRLDAEGLANLVAKIEVEQGVILDAAVAANFISADQADGARAFDIGARLQELTERALPAMKYFARHPEKRVDWLDKRGTTTAGVPLRLPVAYVRNVVEAAQLGTINWTKAAELLMVDRRTFIQRFGELLPPE